MGKAKLVWTILFVTLSLMGANGVSAGRMKLLYLGDICGASPYLALSREPGIDIYPIPAFTMANSHPRELGQRIMRSYFPRTYEGVSAYDAIFLSDVRVDLLTDDELSWIARAVEEVGTGVAMVGGLDSFAGVGGLSWFHTPVGEVLPVTGGRPVWSTARLSWVDEDDELLAGLPFEALLGRTLFAGYNEVEAKAGSRIIAHIASQGRTTPLMARWPVGEGTGFALASEWKGDTYAAFCRTPEECHLRGTKWGNEFASWEFSSDMVRNIAYVVAGEGTAPDPESSRIFRSKSQEVGLAKSLALLQIEFLDKMGIPVESIDSILSRSEDLYRRAIQSFVAGDTQSAISTLDQALENLSRVGRVASGLKSRTLPWANTWIYTLSTGSLLTFGLASAMALRRPPGARE